MSEITLQVGVKVLLQNPEGKFLLMRSNPEKYPEKGAKWDIVGGRINPGTSLMENLKREVLEEASLELVETPTLVAAQDILKVPGKHVVRLTYLGEIEGEPKIDQESLEYKWFSADELAALQVDELDSYVYELILSQVIKLS